MNFLLVFSILFNYTNLNNENNKLVGNWESSSKDLRVNVFIKNEKVFAKLIWFPCTHKVKSPMANHLDTKNPNQKLRSHSWLDLIILSGLQYDKENKWTNGQIYNPESGRTYTAYLQLLSQNKLKVRGYWGFEFIGETLIFNKI